MPDDLGAAGPGRPVLIVGGGIGGMAAALRLRAQGRAVTLVEADPEWRVYGAGISITGPTYRALKRLGVLEEVRSAGYFIDTGSRICRPDGHMIAEIPMHPIEPDLPTSGGVMRPALHRILSGRVRAAGVDLRLGRMVQDWEERDGYVHVRLDDGAAEDFDFVVGADGVFSSIRARLFPQAPAPRYTGQFCFRVVAARPPEIDRHHFFMAGEVTAGLMPVSEEAMYMWLLWNSPEKVRIDPGSETGRLRAVMAPFGGVLGRLRDGLTDETSIIVRPLEAILLPPPWHSGRVILIGDAAHATTPHLASGAGIALEDALVLAEELARTPDVAAAFTAFTARRWERCRLVVERSVEIGRLQTAARAAAGVAEADWGNGGGVVGGGIGRPSFLKKEAKNFCSAVAELHK